MDNKKVLTLGIFAHANAGKTTITEHLLYHAHVINEIGRVDTGNTVTDSMKVEKERGISVRATLVSFELEGKTIQLIDTPGHIDFSAEVERAISILDGAVLVVSGADGVEPQTYTIWRALKHKCIPTIIFINKMDRIGADYNKVLTEIKDKLDRNIVPIIIVQQDDNRNLIYESPSINECVEYLSELDDETLEVYVNKQINITEEWLNKRIEHLAKGSLIYPVIGGSALKDGGVKYLIECINKYLPALEKDGNGNFSAFVYSVRISESRKDIYAKVLSGKLVNRSTVQIDSENEQKIKGLYLIKGSKLTSVDSVQSGEIVIINGIDSTCGKIIGEQRDYDKYVSFVKPLINMRVTTVEDQITKLVEALKILNEEDPYLNLRYDKTTNQIYISLMGEVQAQIIEDILEERFCIKAEFSNPSVIYKETPSIVGAGSASYTKVSSVEFEVSPLPQGSGLIFNSKLSTDFLHRKYQRQAEKLVSQYSKQGLYGWEVTDAEIALVGGRFDSMGSEPFHFNVAVPIALMRALKNCKMKILEPICSFLLETPNDCLSPVLQSLSSKNSNFFISKENGDLISISGEIAFSTIMNFPTELTHITSGRGLFSSRLHKYTLANGHFLNDNYIGADPRNEVRFVINDMGGSLDFLDKEFSKAKKESRSKFKRFQQEKKARQ